MAKPQPPLAPAYFYHIYNHANGIENLFCSDGNYLYFLKLYSIHIAGIADTFAYCLMPNHFHFAIRIKPEEELTKYYQERNSANVVPAGGVVQLNTRQFSNFFNAYVQAFNKQQRRRGGLFNEPYRRVKITSMNYLLNLIHYIHNNPVHHGFVNKMDEWKYSSFHELQTDKETMLARKQALEFFGGKVAFKEFHARKIEKEFLRTVEFD